MTRASDIPAVPPKLLAKLEESFPDKLPDGLTTEAQIAQLIGQQDVIRLLRRWRDHPH